MDRVELGKDISDLIEKVRREKRHPNTDKAFEFFQPQLISNLVMLNIVESLDLVKKRYLSLDKYNFSTETKRLLAHNDSNGIKYFGIESEVYEHLNYLVNNKNLINEKWTRLKIDMSPAADVRDEISKYLIDFFEKEFANVGLKVKEYGNYKNGLKELEFLIDMEKVTKEGLDKLVFDCGFDSYMTLEEFSQAFSKAVYAQ